MCSLSNLDIPCSFIFLQSNMNQKMTKFFLVLMSNVTKFILILMAIYFPKGDLGSSMFKFTNNKTEQKVKDQIFIVFQLFLAFQEWASEVVLVTKNLSAKA